NFQLLINKNVDRVVHPIAMLGMVRHRGPNKRTKRPFAIGKLGGRSEAIGRSFSGRMRSLLDGIVTGRSATHITECKRRLYNCGAAANENRDRVWPSSTNDEQRKQTERNATDGLFGQQRDTNHSRTKFRTNAGTPIKVFRRGASLRQSL